MTAFHVGRGPADVASQSVPEREAEEKGGLSSSYGLQLVGRMMIGLLNTHPPPLYPNRRYEINTNTAASRNKNLNRRQIIQPIRQLR